MTDAKLLDAAIGALKEMIDRIRLEKWADETAKRSVLTGIRMSITKLQAIHRETP